VAAVQIANIALGDEDACQNWNLAGTHDTATSAPSKAASSSDFCGGIELKCSS